MPKYDHVKRFSRLTHIQDSVKVTFLKEHLFSNISFSCVKRNRNYSEPPPFNRTSCFPSAESDVINPTVTQNNGDDNL